MININDEFFFFDFACFPGLSKEIREVLPDGNICDSLVIFD